MSSFSKLEAFQKGLMKKESRFWLFVIMGVIISLTLFTGCSTTPRHSVVQVFVSTNYTVAQPPVRLEIKNDGRQWNQFVREYNAERLEHNLRQAQIENRSAEQNRAKELGVSYAPPTLGQQPQAVSAAGNGGVHFYSPYPQVRPFFGTPTYFYTPYSGGYGYGSGTYMYGGAGAYGSLGGNCQPRGRLFGINFRQSSPGYRHTGGPVTEIRQHSIGGIAVGGGGFTSGLNFYRPW